MKKNKNVEYAVQLIDVHKRYGTGENAVNALQGVTIDFMYGSFTAIMGPSGSGKSTLLQCAAGLDRPTSGSVIVAGTNISSISETKLTILRRNKIGFVFQSFNLISALTAEQNVVLPLRLSGRKPNSSDVRDVLTSVGLSNRARHRPAEMSGGQQQRVAIARALITRPDVLFADEPTGALDSATGRDVLRLLRELANQQNMQAIIMVTHDPIAAAYADRVVFLVDGKVIDELWKPTSQTVAERMTRLEADNR